MNRKGFTLLEIMIAAVIVAIVAMIAVPNFQSMVANQRLRDDMSQIEGDLHVARLTAINRGVPIAVVFNPPAGFMVFIDDGAGGGSARDLAKNGTEETLIQRTLKTGVTFSLVDFNGGSALLFNPKGFRVIPSANNSKVELQSSQGKKFRISVTLAGDINVQAL